MRLIQIYLKQVTMTLNELFNPALITIIMNIIIFLPRSPAGLGSLSYRNVNYAVLARGRSTTTRTGCLRDEGSF